MRGLVNLLRLERDQRVTPEALAARRDRRVRRLVDHAYSKVAYYRELLDAARLSPRDIQGAGDLHLIPVTTRQDLQARPLHELTAAGRDLSRCYASRTSGATGEPLTILGDRADRSFVNPSFLRVYLAWGLLPWHRIMSFAFRPGSRSPRSWYQSAGVFRHRVLSVEDAPENWIRELDRWRPHLLQGYALTLKLFAESMQKSGRRDLRVPLVANTSGFLDDSGRELLAAVFQSKVIDIYASEEAGAAIAWQCPVCKEYHLSTDTSVTEFLRAGRPVAVGEEGDVVITNLHNYSMPFIRYAQGDRAVPSPREPICGRPFPLMARINGRSGDYVVLPSGRKLSPHPFFRVLDEIVGVSAWRLTQESTERIRVEIVHSGLWQNSLEQRVLQDLRAIVGDEMEIRLHPVAELRRDPYQKLRSVVSQVSVEPGDSAPAPGTAVSVAR